MRENRGVPPGPALSDAQARVVAEWFPGARLVADLSWGLTDTVVHRLRTGWGDVVVKAAGPGNHHIGREITAHQRWTAVWRDAGRASRLLHADRDRNLLATSFLPGHLVQGHPAADDPDSYRQAGALLARFHAQAAAWSDDYEARADAKAVAWLDGEHRIDAPTEARLREVIAGHERPPALLVPTHGDWQPRNWVVHRGRLGVIDLGRAQWRPGLTDLARMAAREWLGRPDLEAAFLTGYGGDPREPAAWRRHRVREAVGTAAWAHQVGDEAFEAQGHLMISRVLREL